MINKDDKIIVYISRDNFCDTTRQFESWYICEKKRGKNFLWKSVSSKEHGEGLIKSLHDLDNNVALSCIHRSDVNIVYMEDTGPFINDRGDEI